MLFRSVRASDLGWTCLFTVLSRRLGRHSLRHLSQRTRPISTYGYLCRPSWRNIGVAGFFRREEASFARPSPSPYARAARKGTATTGTPGFRLSLAGLARDDWRGTALTVMSVELRGSMSSSPALRTTWPVTREKGQPDTTSSRDVGSSQPGSAHAERSQLGPLLQRSEDLVPTRPPPRQPSLIPDCPAMPPGCEFVDSLFLLQNVLETSETAVQFGSSGFPASTYLFFSALHPQ